MAVALLGLGSNVGERFDFLQRAIESLKSQAAIRVLRVSSFIETRPIGGPEAQGAFLNAALVVETELSSSNLLAALIAIERQLGRERNERWGPRTIDLDLLLYGEEVFESAELTLPHPRLHERRFVLAPAVEIAPDWRHPRLNRTIAQLLAELPAATRGDVGMRIYTSPTDVQAAVMNCRRQGGRIGLVPTMGALHEGHLSLVKMARQRADVVAATIFVNPTQFGPREDFSRYPRTLEADLQKLSAAGCDLVFVPQAADIFPPGYSTYVEPPAVAMPLEGVCRPGHFRGVATVVLKLFNLLPPDVACFGQKDFQQLLVIRRMVEDLALPIEITPCPIVREADELAMSSRNRYLSPADRERALALSRALAKADQLVTAGERDAARLQSAMRDTLLSAGIDRIDYVALADPETLAEKTTIDRPTIALIAAYVGATRLIDNRPLLPPPRSQRA